MDPVKPSTVIQGAGASAADEGTGLKTLVGLLPQHVEQLQASGLSEATIAASGVFSVEDPAEAHRLLNLWPGADVSVPALAFPYPGCPGYVRLRPDKSLGRNPDFSPQVDHDYRKLDIPEFEPGPKYLAPWRQPTRLYAPTALQPGILDPAVPLWLTEGEKKALAGCQAGMAIVAAPGVTCFGDAAARLWSKGIGQDVRKVHPDFARLGIPLKGRKVIILFDSDIDSNPAVLAAAAVLGKMLHAAGADVHIAYLDDVDTGKKVGLDDYLASLPVAERTGLTPPRSIEESVRPFNVEDCLEDHMEHNWDVWNRPHRDRELERAVKLACHLFRRREDLRKWCSKAAKVLREDLDHVQSFIVDANLAKDRDPRAWVSAWLAHHQVELDVRTDRLTLRGQAVDSDTLFREMALDAVTYGGPWRRSLEDALHVWREDERHHALKRLQGRLKHRPQTGEDELGKFTRAVTGAEDSVDVAVFAHFVWQVKRKLFDLPVEHHLMPILFAPQGAGKSVALWKFLEPVVEFADSLGDLTVLSDERQVFRLAQCLVAFVDEMAKADRVDMASLKGRITAPTVSWRILGTNRRATGRNIATFIGATNQELPDLIIDPTGVRRFYQVTCTNPLDWELVNGIDYLALWTSVDECATSPIVEVLDEVRRRQEAMRAKDAVEEFLAEMCVVSTAWTCGRDAFAAFKTFLEDQNLPRQYWTSTKFGRRLKSLLGKDGWKQSDGIKYHLAIKSAGHAVNEELAVFLGGVAGSPPPARETPPLALVRERP
jgi:hypothetical protein